jgi:pyruvate/2-oxoglutarate/acetoin dehydrogenase E1 component
VAQSRVEPESKEAEIVKSNALSRIAILIEEQAKQHEFGTTYIASVAERPFLHDITGILRIHGYKAVYWNDCINISWASVDVTA